jgi:VRR-NUC domain.
MGGKDDMTEKEIEQMLVREVKRRGGWALKFISPGLNGVPDRLLLMQGGKIGFVELKAPGRKMRPLQIKRKEQLESLGFLVYCIDDPKQIGGAIDGIEKAGI